MKSSGGYTDSIIPESSTPQDGLWTGQLMEMLSEDYVPVISRSGGLSAAKTIDSANSGDTVQVVE